MAKEVQIVVSAKDLASGVFVKVGSSAGTTINNVEKLGGAIGRVADRMTSFGSLSSMTITAPLALAGKSALTAAADFEQAEVALTTMTGSAKIAQKYLNELGGFARKTPFRFSELLQETRKIQAYGFAIKDTIPLLTILGDATSALGLSTEGLDRLVVALGQIKAKGTLQTQEMRQIAETGINAWEYLAKVLNTDVAGAMKMVEDRMVDSKTALSAILEGMANDPRFKDMMKKQADTIAGLWSNLMDTLYIGAQKNGKTLAEAFDIKDRLKEAIKWLEGFTVWIDNLDPKTKKFAANMLLIAAAAGPVAFALGNVTKLAKMVLSPLSLLLKIGPPVVKFVKDYVLAVKGVELGSSAAGSALVFMNSKLAIMGKTLAGGAIVTGLLAVAGAMWKVADAEKKMRENQKLSDTPVEKISNPKQVTEALKLARIELAEAQKQEKIALAEIKGGAKGEYLKRAQQGLEDAKRKQEAANKRIQQLTEKKKTLSTKENETAPYKQSEKELEDFFKSLSTGAMTLPNDKNKTSADVMKEWRKEMKEAVEQGNIFGETFNVAEEQLGITKSKIAELVSMGLTKNSPEVKELSATFKELSVSINDAAKEAAFFEYQQKVWAEREEEYLKQYREEAQKNSEILKIYTDLAEETKNLTALNSLLGDEYGDLASKINLYESAIVAAVKTGDTQSEAFKNLLATFKDLKGQMQALDYSKSIYKEVEGSLSSAIRAGFHDDGILGSIKSFAQNLGGAIESQLADSMAKAIMNSSAGNWLTGMMGGLFGGIKAKTGTEKATEVATAATGGFWSKLGSFLPVIGTVGLVGGLFGGLFGKQKDISMSVSANSAKMNIDFAEANFKTVTLPGTYMGGTTQNINSVAPVVNVSVNVAGSVLAERDLQKTIKSGAEAAFNALYTEQQKWQAVTVNGVGIG